MNTENKFTKTISEIRNHQKQLSKRFEATRHQKKLLQDRTNMTVNSTQRLYDTQY